MIYRLNLQALLSFIANSFISDGPTTLPFWLNATALTTMVVSRKNVLKTRCTLHTNYTRSGVGGDQKQS